MDEPASALVVVGASAGGVGPLRALAAALPRDLSAAVAIVLHVSPARPSHLPEILGRAGHLPVTHARGGEPLLSGHIYVAPPDHHLLVHDGRCLLVRGPRENQSRPAVDPLFRSAADSFGPRALGVILSGARDDGVAGAAAISGAGGVVIVQEPAEAEFGDMPANTIAGDHPDRVLPLERIAPAIVEIVGRLSREGGMSENDGQEMSVETRYAALDRETIEQASPPGEPSAFGCPACGGVLWEIETDGGPPRFRCRVGHAYTVESALDQQSEEIDRALWAAFRALHERAEMSERMVARLRRSPSHAHSRLESSAREAREQAELIRTVLLERDARAS